MSHICHHPTCNTHVPERMFACRGHWFSLPRKLRDQIWATYVPGQEIAKTPSGEYLDAAMACVRHWQQKT